MLKMLFDMLVLVGGFALDSRGNLLSFIGFFAGKFSGFFLLCEGLGAGSGFGFWALSNAWLFFYLLICRGFFGLFFFLLDFCLLFSSRLPGGGITFFAAAKKVIKESSFSTTLNACPAWWVFSIPWARRECPHRPSRSWHPCDPCFLAHSGNGPLRLTPARFAAGVSQLRKPAANHRNAFARDIVLSLFDSTLACALHVLKRHQYTNVSDVRCVVSGHS
jgi:hypothetical protein